MAGTAPGVVVPVTGWPGFVPGIGVRIEDSFLLDGSGLRNLSQALPKTVADIEASMRGGR